MPAFTDALRAHLEEHGLPLHPQGEDFDDHQRHPTGNRGWKPDLAFVHRSMEGHSAVSCVLDDAIDHVLKNGKGNPALTLKKDEDGYEDGKTHLHGNGGHQFGEENTRYEMENGDTYHVHHGAWREGDNTGLGLEGHVKHAVRIDHW